MAEFHWVGSTAGNINSLRWGNISNWRVVQYGIAGSTAPGGTLARLIPATRLPYGTDTVWFGPSVLLTTQSQNPSTPPRYQIYSPCLFGGVTTATDRVWEGATMSSAGSGLSYKYGTINFYVSPKYPFSRIGGYVDSQILNEWTSHLNAMGLFSSSGWTLSSGAEYDNAQYTATNWFGVTGGISFAQQTSYNIRTRGIMYAKGHNRTTITAIGLTAGLTGSPGTNYDGTVNRVHLGVWHINGAFGVPTSVTQGSNSTNDGFTGQAFTTNGVGSVAYDANKLVLSGNWNSIVTDNAPSNVDITINDGKVNSITLKPTYYLSLVSPTTAAGVQSYQITNPQSSQFVVGSLYIDETSSLRHVQIGNIKRHDANKEISVFGDITPTGGFVCALPAGPSAGASGGVLYTNGSLVVESPAELASGDTDGALLRLGFSQYDGSTKATTTIDKVYALQNTDASTRVVIDGPVDISEFHLHGGTCEKGSGLQASAAVTIDNLYLYGNAVYDQTTNPSHYNTTAKIRVMSNSASVKPGAETTLDVGHVDNN